MLTISAQKKVIFDRARCCQCGVCLASCKWNAFSHSFGSDGLLDITIDEDKCSVCGLCEQVCPAHQLPNDRVSEEQIHSAKAIRIGHAKDNRIRYLSSSGGTARTLIEDVLTTGGFDAVYSLVFPVASERLSEHPESIPDLILEPPDSVTFTRLEAEGTWLTTFPPIEQIPCSLYRSIPWGKNLDQCTPTWRKILLVGLPCQIKGAKLLLKYRLRNTEIISVAIFCRKQKTLGHTKCIKRMVGAPDSPTANVFYRGHGWPGMSGVHKNAEILKIPYFYHARCWTVPACHLCADCMAPAHADITLADPWSIENPQDNPAGSNLIFSWTAAGKDILEQAHAKLVLSECDTEKAIMSVEFRQIREKIDAIPYYSGHEKSRLRRLRYCLMDLITYLTEVELNLIHPNSRIIRWQLCIRRLMVRTIRMASKTAKRICNLPSS